MTSQREGMTGPTLSPPWLCAYGSNAQRFMYTIGVALDALLEKQQEAEQAKFPGYGDESLIPLQAADRLMVQGPSESNEAFQLRLQGAMDAWGRAGSRAAILGQIQAYLTDTQPDAADGLPECLIVGGTGTSICTWSTIYTGDEQGKEPARARTVSNWNWDGEDKNARAWLILFMFLTPVPGLAGAAMSIPSTGGTSVAGVTTGFANVTGLTGMTADQVQQYLTVTGAASGANNGSFQIVEVTSATTAIIANPDAVAPDANDGSLTWTVQRYPYIGPAPVWGSPDYVWGDGTWGVNCSELVIQSIRAILRQWKSAQAYYPMIGISFGGGTSIAGTEFSPNSSQGAGNPDGTWGSFGKSVNGVWVPARQAVNPFTVFCDGTGRSVRCFEKNQT